MTLANLCRFRPPFGYTLLPRLQLRQPFQWLRETAALSYKLPCGEIEQGI